MTLQNPEPFIAAPAASRASNATTLPIIIDALPSDASHPAQTQFNRTRQAAFLQRLADCGEVRVAARASNVSHQTVYRLRRACRTFKQGWDAALLVARERAEDALATRAMHGVEEQVFYHGEVVATRRRYDSRLLLAHLARLDRLAERADVAELAGQFDALLAALETEDDSAAEAVVEGAHAAVEEARIAAEEAAREKSSGPCNMRSMSPDAPPHAPDDETAGEPVDATGCDEEKEALPELERRLRAMEAARPHDAPSLYSSGMARDAEALQLLAFEEGVANWWEIAQREDLPEEVMRKIDW